MVKINNVKTRITSYLDKIELTKKEVSLMKFITV